MQNPTTEEEKCIEDAYTYLYKNLKEENLRKQLKRRYGANFINQLDYIDMIKAVRDQVLNTTFVSISTQDRKQANMIFEILNAKGKRLSDVDLIKNRIFEIVSDTEPADFAEEKWKSINEILNSRNIDVGFVQFYRHFWISKYKKSGVNKLYDGFKAKIQPENEITYKNFLKDMENTANLYVKVIAPERKDFLNKKEYFGIIQSMNILCNDFNIVQVRIALLSLIEAKENGYISLNQLKDAIYYLEGFHFVYNALCSKPTNKLEGIYSDFSINLRNCKNKGNAKIIISELIKKLDELYISYLEFENYFIDLSYTKNNSPFNIKTKYAINKIATFFSCKELFEDDGSIEHILPESNDVENNNIGNLILLELELNKKASNFTFQEKVEIYKKSNYKWIKTFLNENETWSFENIQKRSKKLAKLYYTKILKKNIDQQDEFDTL